VPAESGKQRTRRQTLLLVLAVIVLNAVGNLSLTWGLRHVSDMLGANPLQYVSAMLHPFVAAGIAMLILWLLSRMALMSWADLSFVQPVTAIGYVLNAVLGHFFLHEKVTLQHWFGTFLIFAGALLVGATAAQGRSTHPKPGISLP
jgi:uncharacterized membrane protein